MNRCTRPLSFRVILVDFGYLILRHLALLFIFVVSKNSLQMFPWLCHSHIPTDVSGLRPPTSRLMNSNLSKLRPVRTLIHKMLPILCTSNIDVFRSPTLDKNPSLVGLRSPTSRFAPDKKLICISPGGLKGFYLSGVVAYIKENYDVSEFYVSGASAGAWNAVLFTYRGNLTEFMRQVISSKPVITKNETIRTYKYYLKNTILENYTSDDFDLHRIFIGVTTITQFFKISNSDKFSSDYSHSQSGERRYPKSIVKTSIYSGFTKLEDALDCCIASSHIPFIMGKIFHIYDNKISFDGGFSSYPYYSGVKPVLNITVNMWNRSYDAPPKRRLDGSYQKKYRKLFDEYTSILSKDRYNFWELFKYGYEDSHKNREILDKILHRRKPN